MWVIAVVEAALWAGYGTVRGDVALVFLGVVGATAGIAVLVRLAVTAPVRDSYPHPGAEVHPDAWGNRGTRQANAALTTSA
jgi:hypothetical protein